MNEVLNEKILNFLSEESKFIEIAPEQEEQPSGTETEEAEETNENQEKSGE